ncbi:stretch-activated Ca2+-permeable channel component-domain-containing protein [Melampsora americana]|nr:stretch-activated Ca2+-permeable channel component-domain-containing protein [Melampsora americana]
MNSLKLFSNLILIFKFQKMKKKKHEHFLSISISISLFIQIIQIIQSELIEINRLPFLNTLSISNSSSTLFHLPPTSSSNTTSSSSSSDLIYITLNICSPPKNQLNHVQITYDSILIVSNSTSNQSPNPDRLPTHHQSGLIASSYLGFANLTIINSVGLWIYLNSPTPNENQTWSIQLAIDHQPIHQVNNFPAFRVEDTDQTNALLTASDSSLFQSIQDQSPFSLKEFIPFIIKTPLSFPLGLSSSLCAIQLLNSSSSTEILNLNQLQLSLTQRNLGIDLPSSQNTGIKSDRDFRISSDSVGQRTQYLLNSLTSATNYTAWLFQPGLMINNVQTGKLWPYVNFKTKIGNHCRLLHDLSFCPELAYSVPSPVSLSTLDLINFYQSQLIPHLQNFSTVLNTYPCNNGSSGRYSFVTGCGDCLKAYTNWLCGMILPRCTDSPLIINSTFEDFQDPWESQLVLNRNDLSQSRTPQLINLTLKNPSFSYGEIPPCIETCDYVAATCPPFLGWKCPLRSSISGAYGSTRYLSSIEVQGGESNEKGQGGFRSTDRFGNVFCNALGSDLNFDRMGSSERLKIEVKWIGLWGVLIIGLNHFGFDLLVL